MTSLLQIVAIVGIAYTVWLLRSIAHEYLDFRYAKRQEIRRWLQAEAQNEEVLKQKLKAEPDEMARLDLELEFARDRSRRLTSYVLMQSLEKEH